MNDLYDRAKAIAEMAAKLSTELAIPITRAYAAIELAANLPPQKPQYPSAYLPGFDDADVAAFEARRKKAPPADDE
jgi:hypothetical protein